MPTVFSQSEVEAIASALGETEVGLTGSQIGHLLQQSRMTDPQPAATKRYRLLAAFAESQNARRDRSCIVAFIRKAMKPAIWLREMERYEPLRAKLNIALAFAGLEVDAAGIVTLSERVQTIPEAQRRAAELRADMQRRGIHPDVLAFCRVELVADDYFHAVLEAMKSVAVKIRERTGLDVDGAALVDRAIGGEAPMLAINPLQTAQQRTEQSAFANLLKGAFGMFRNPTAHAARLHWPMTKEDAEDLLSMASLMHRRLDGGHMPPRA